MQDFLLLTLAILTGRVIWDLIKLGYKARKNRG